MKKIKELWAEYKASKNKAHVNAVHSQFQVKERGGYLWLTHDGVAFLKMNADDTSANVAGMLKTARENAVEYEGL